MCRSMPTMNVGGLHAMHVIADVAALVVLADANVM